MSMSLEEAAMLSWNQPVIAESNNEVAVPDVKETFEQQQTIEVVDLPLPASTNVVENLENIETTETQDYKTEEETQTIADVADPVIFAEEFIIPLEGMKPIGDISQQDLDDITCTLQETIQRVEICKKCPEFKIENMITKCSACDCSISMVTTFKYKACPAGNW